MIFYSIRDALRDLKNSNPHLSGIPLSKKIEGSSGESILCPMSINGVNQLLGSKDSMLIMAASTRIAAINILAIDHIEKFRKKEAYPLSESETLLSLMEMILASIQRPSSRIYSPSLNIDSILDYEKKYNIKNNLLSSSFEFPVLFSFTGNSELNIGNHFLISEKPVVFCTYNENYDIYSIDGLLPLFVQSHNLLESSLNLYSLLESFLLRKPKENEAHKIISLSNEILQASLS